MKTPPILALLSLIFLSTLQAGNSSAFRLANIFGDHMVVQAEQPIRIWGWDTPGANVTVTFAGKTAQAEAAQDGRWIATLAPTKTGGPYTLNVQGSGTTTLEDVWAGQVWIAAGQSNMVLRAQHCDEAEQIAADSKDRTLLRLTSISQGYADAPQADIERRAQWRPASEGIGGFSAVGASFANDLQAGLDQPVGIIQVAVGGSKIESWVPMDVLAGNPATADRVGRYDEKLKEYEAAKAKGDTEMKAPGRNKYAAFLYNKMAAPLQDISAAGIIWYQGESNSGDGDDYIPLFQDWISQWRKMTHSPDLPVFIVQLPFYHKQQTEPVENDSWGYFRYVQTKVTEAVPHSDYVVTLDTGNAEDVHPRQKQVIGQRLAALALETVYGKDLPGQPPEAVSLKAIGQSRYSIGFENLYGALKTFDSEAPRGLAIQGDNGEWQWAQDLAIDKDTLTFRSPTGSPKAVRYNWASNPVGNLANAAGHPVGPFELTLDEAGQG